LSLSFPVKLGDLQAALEAFEKSLEMAKLQEDKKAENAIKKAIKEVNQKIVKSMKDGEKKDGDDKGEINTFGFEL